jgi:hypothetical protein
MKKAILIISLLLVVTFGFAQNVIVLQGTILDGDTIPQINLKEVEVMTFKIPPTRRGRRKLTRLIKNVKRVYPYAKLAGIKLRQYDYLLRKAETERQRKKLMKRAEKEINQEYGGELKNLTFSQGKILIKLIDRETGETSFNLVQELRGNFTAFFYQTFARIWGYNLKVRYDPLGEDRQIEAVVRMIELGQL